MATFYPFFFAHAATWPKVLAASPAKSTASFYCGDRSIAINTQNAHPQKLIRALPIFRAKDSKNSQDKQRTSVNFFIIEDISTSTSF